MVEGSAYTKVWRQGCAGAPGDWHSHKRCQGERWERTRIQTGAALPQASNVSSVLAFSGRTELGVQKEDRTGNQTDLGLMPVPRTIRSRWSISIC